MSGDLCKSLITEMTLFADFYVYVDLQKGFPLQLLSTIFHRVNGILAELLK